MDFMKDLF